MSKVRRVHRPSRPHGIEELAFQEKPSLIRSYAPMVLGGVALVLSVAFAGHYMGRNAIAHNAAPDEPITVKTAQTSALLTKGSLLPQGTTFKAVNVSNVTTVLKQTVISDGKGDFLRSTAPSQMQTVEVPANVKIIPASIDMKAETNAGPEKRVVMSPSTAKIEQTFKLKRSEKTAQNSQKKRDVVQQRLRLAEENCLARAVYFEARSESELGQLAVARVILNRVKDPEYPKTICGVVYQGSGSRNSCQFSFACDGLPDDVKSANAWRNAKRIAQKAMAGDASVAAIGKATNYHADYVNPRWAKNMKRMAKIGRHIFYTDG